MFARIVVLKRVRRTILSTINLPSYALLPDALTLIVKMDVYVNIITIVASVKSLKKMPKQEREQGKKKRLPQALLIFSRKSTTRSKATDDLYLHLEVFIYFQVQYLAWFSKTFI